MTDFYLLPGFSLKLQTREEFYVDNSFGYDSSRKRYIKKCRKHGLKLIQAGWADDGGELYDHEHVPFHPLMACPECRVASWTPSKDVGKVHIISNLRDYIRG